MLTWCTSKFSLKMQKVAATAFLIQSPSDYRQTDPTIFKKTIDGRASELGDRCSTFSSEQGSEGLRRGQLPGGNAHAGEHQLS